MINQIRTIKVNVTAADIDAGQRYIKGECQDPCHYCAVARAVSRVVGAPVRWVYESGRVEEHRKRDSIIHVVYAHQQRVRTFVERHDALKPVKPFSFLATVMEAAA